MTTPGGYSAGTIFLTVVPSFKNFQKLVRQEAKAADRAFGDEMRKGRSEQDAADRRSAEKRGRDSGGAYARAMQQAISKALGALPKQKIDVDSSAAEARLAVIRARLEALDGKDIKIGANTREAMLLLKRLQEELKEIAIASTDAEITVNAGTAFAALKKVDHDLDKIDGRHARAHVSVSGTGEAQRGLKGMFDHLDKTGNSFRAFNGLLLAATVLLPLLVPAAAAAAGAIAGLGVALTAGALGIGVLVAGFSGIGDAVTALSNVHKNAAKDAITQAKAIRTAAKTVRDAEQGVARTREMNARAAEDAGRAVVDALRRQKDAEQDLRDTQKDATKAQQKLVEARAEAQKQQDDLANRLAGGALAERQAVIDLFEATVAFNNAMADGAATNLDREQASINLGEAKLHLKEIREENVDLAKQQAKTTKDGIKGNAQVVEATDAVAAANQRVADAQQRAADAAQGVKDAQRDQARASADAAIAMRDATERLTDAQEAQGETLRSLAEVGSGAQLQLADAMSKLGPAGQAFAIFLESTVLPKLREMRNVIQENLLPGVTDFLRTIFVTYGPQITAFLGDMSKVLGDLFRQFGELMKTPAWQDFWGMMAAQGPELLRLWGEIGLNFLTIIAQLMTALAPLATQMLTWLAQVTKKFSDFLGTPAGKKAMQKFLEFVERVGPKVMDFFSALGGALINLGRALAPYAEVLLRIFTGLLDFIAGMDPKVLGAFVIAFLALVFAIQVLLGISALITTIVSVSTILEAIGIAAGGAAIGIGALVATIAIIVAVVAALVILYMNSETFRDIVNGAFKAVADFIGWIWDNYLKPVFSAWIWYFGKVWEVASAIFDLLIKAFQALGRKIGEAWTNFTESPGGKAIVGFFRDYVQPAWEAFAGWVSTFWNGIVNLFKKGVVFVVDTVINDGLIDGFNWLADKFGSKKISRITLPATMYSDSGSKTAPKKATAFGLATGGFVPGFSPTPTADNIPAMLTAGEYVLPVGAVRALRSQFGDNFLEALRRGLPGFASGGLVAFGRLLQGRGFKVSEHPAFGGVHPVHAKNSRHYANQAIDVNWAPGQSAAEMAAIDAIVGLAPEYGLRTIWRTEGHYNHAHFDTGKGKSLLGKLGSSISGLGGVLKDAAGAVIGAPKDWLFNKVRGLYGDLRNTTLGNLMIGGAETLTGYAVDKLLGIAGAVGDFFTADGKSAGDGYAEGGPVLYDNGGWLQPGLTTVLNASGRPEPVFSAPQWERMQSSSSSMAGGLTINGEFHGADGREIVDELMFEVRRRTRGGVYAGSTT